MIVSVFDNHVHPNQITWALVLHVSFWLSLHLLQLNSKKRANSFSDLGEKWNPFSIILAETCSKKLSTLGKKNQYSQFDADTENTATIRISRASNLKQWVETSRRLSTSLKSIVTRWTKFYIDTLCEMFFHSHGEWKASKQWCHCWKCNRHKRYESNSQFQFVRSIINSVLSIYKGFHAVLTSFSSVLGNNKNRSAQMRKCQQDRYYHSKVSESKSNARITDILHHHS